MPRSTTEPVLAAVIHAIAKIAPFNQRAAVSVGGAARLGHRRDEAAELAITRAAADDLAGWADARGLQRRPMRALFAQQRLEQVADARARDHVGLERVRVAVGQHDIIVADALDRRD